MSLVQDTIVAIATAHGEGAIGIVRLSGSEAQQIAAQFVRLASRQSIQDVTSHTVHYGHVVDGAQVVDEVLVSVFLAPRTVTRENVVEISCHGGMLVTNRVLQLALRCGARLAEPGEFTKRAFLNGRIDLSQAEAVMDLIRARSDRARQVAMGQVQGRLANQIRQLRQQLLQTLAQVEVAIDYPEYDGVEEMTAQMMRDEVSAVRRVVHQLLQTAQQGKILRDGIATAIVGRPNVGKSSLLNTLVQEEKAIVTDIEGTTRDSIEEYVTVRGVPLKLIDTAGIRETDNVVEQIGVARSKQILAQAELVILVLNQAEALQEADVALLEQTVTAARIVVCNKQDLPSQLDETVLAQYIDLAQVVRLSLRDETGIEALEERIAQLFFAGTVEQAEASYVSNSRHIALLEQTDQALQEVLTGLAAGMPIDLLQIDLTKSWELLGDITGETVQDELLTQLFSQFCLGK